MMSQDRSHPAAGGSRRVAVATLAALAALLAAALGPGTAPAVADAAAAAKTGRTPAILGGSPTTIGKWPWQVGIATSSDVSSGNAYRRQFCGGSLVAPTVVITAAHCVFSRGGFQRPERFTVITGRTRLASSAGQEIAFADFFYPTDSQGRPRYSTRSTRWDVVVVQLASASTSETIKVAGADERALWAAGQRVHATGWGQIGEKGSFPNRLRAVSMKMISDQSCRSQLGVRFKSETMVCAFRKGHDTCGGDSGGPLVAPMAGGGFRLVGDTSFGIGPCGTNPGVYGRLASDPILSFLRETALRISGVDIVGSGASPP
jgi:secreted trypsin-like serine protease